MMRLLLLLTLAFGALPSSAQTPQPGWIADAKTGCRMWFPNVLAKATVTWSGACSNNLAQGRGSVQWFVDGKPHGRFDGEFRGGKTNGRGSYVAADNGYRSELDYRDGLANGFGVIVWATDGRYEGQFRDGKRQGHGILTWPDGDRHEGEFRDNTQSGHGVFVRADGDRYEGEFRDGDFNGRGILTRTNGERYEGDFHDGRMSGRGVFTWPNGARYEGEFRDGKPNGSGTLKSGQVYTGTWKNGCFRQGDRTAWAGATKEECGFK